jgi:hypothetical protein
MVNVIYIPLWQKKLILLLFPKKFKKRSTFLFSFIQKGPTWASQIQWMLPPNSRVVAISQKKILTLFNCHIN